MTANEQPREGCGCVAAVLTRDAALGAAVRATVEEFDRNPALWTQREFVARIRNLIATEGSKTK